MRHFSYADSTVLLQDENNAATMQVDLTDQGYTVKEEKEVRYLGLWVDWMRHIECIWDKITT